MLARFFASRPVFAWVISIAIMLAGIASIMALPISQYPDVAPPSVNISAGYVGASAATVENSVTQVLEQQLTGIDGLLYFSSSSSSSGNASINVTFRQGTNPDTAQVQVQNKVQQAIPRLPPTVQQQGIVVTKSQTNFLTIVGVYDELDKATEGDIADYLASTLQDPIARVDGVAKSNQAAFWHTPIWDLYWSRMDSWSRPRACCGSRCSCSLEVPRPSTTSGRFSGDKGELTRPLRVTGSPFAKSLISWIRTRSRQCLQAVGCLDEAIAAYRAALIHQPDAAHVHSHLVHARIYHPGYDAQAILEGCRNWNDRHAQPLAVSIKPHLNDPSPSGD